MSRTTRTKYYDVAYAPYGEDYAGSGTQDLMFTGQNQDTVGSGWSVNLYDFLFREYRTAQGRWISPDPAGLGAVSPSNPQSWNRYAYVMNNPLSLTDPLGLDNDCGGPCIPFSFGVGGGCVVNVSYHKETGAGGTYDVPDYSTSCRFGHGLFRSLGEWDDLRGTKDKLPKWGRHTERNLLQGGLFLTLRPTTVDCNNPSMSSALASATLSGVTEYVRPSSIVMKADIGDATVNATRDPLDTMKFTVPFIPGFDSKIGWTFSGGATNPYYKDFKIKQTQTIECKIPEGT